MKIAEQFDGFMIKARLAGILIDSFFVGYAQYEKFRYENDIGLTLNSDQELRYLGVLVLTVNTKDAIGICVTFKGR